MNERPLVSIGMPVYNGEDFIRGAIESLLAQTFEDFELIISDNGSNDGTSKICREYENIDTRIRYRRSPENMGALNNFLAVLELARGEFFMWAAHDDRWEPTFVSSGVDILQCHSDVSMAFCIVDQMDREGRYFSEKTQLWRLQGQTRFGGLVRYFWQRGELGKPNVIYSLMRRKNILKTGGLEKWCKDRWGGDMLFVFQMISIGRLMLTKETLFHKRLILDIPEKTKPAENPFNLKKLVFFGKDFSKDIWDTADFLFTFHKILRESNRPFWEVWTISLLGIVRLVAYMFTKSYSVLIGNIYQIAHRSCQK